MKNAFPREFSIRKSQCRDGEVRLDSPGTRKNIASLRERQPMASKEAGINSDLERFLRSLKNDDIVYIPNYGNAGDAFIAQATYQMFSRLGLGYELGNITDTYPNRVIICGGGGNLVDAYGTMINFIRRNLGTWRKLVILPHTIRAYEDTLHQFEANCYVYCREPTSFDFVRRRASRANVFLSHDLAIGCDLAEIEQQMRARWLRDLFNSRLAVRNAKRLARVVRYNLNNYGSTAELNAFRTDVEKTRIPIPASNFDVSNYFTGSDLTPNSCLHACYWMMAFINRFDSVRTNRLHVGIMAALLGKQLFLYDNAYGKVRDVFLHSMRDRFSNVHWQGIGD